jgi:SOS response regulatory protein OraA/RecX
VRGNGRSRILRELDAHGVDPGLALEAVSDALPAQDEEESAMRLARALAARSNPDVGRIASRLARKGFAPALALRSARTAVGERADDDTSDLPVFDD